MKFLFVLFLTACGAIPFDVDQDIAEQRVPGSALGGVLPAFLPSPVPLMINLKAETQSRDTGPAQSANLKELRFHATSSGNFDFVDEIHISVDSPSQPSLPQKEIARLSPVPKGQTTLELQVVDGVDLLPYINAGAEISATATGHAPAQDFTYDGHVTITVHI